MRYYLIIFSFLISFISIQSSGKSNEEIKRPKYKIASEAYGYLLGQDYSLNKIKNEFPQLDLKVTRVQLLFNSNFGNSKQKLKSYLYTYLGEKEFNSYEEKLLSEMKNLYSNQTFTEEAALNYITTVENRAKGQISSPVLETILSFQYLDNPKQEFLEGFTKTFRTKGQVKAKGTDWQIKVPKSWRAEDADQPSIVKKFIEDNGHGNQMIMLTVNEIPLAQGEKLTKEDINNFFTENGIRNIVPPEGKFISFKKMNFDNNNGGLLEVEQTVTRLDHKIKIRMLQFMFIRGNKMYILQGTVGSIKEGEDLSLKMQKYLPLYRLIANSIVVYS